MYSRCNGPILFGAIVICVALAVMESDTIVRKPYGPKMCAHLYKRTAGCSPYFYRISDLSCRLNPVTLPKHNSEKKIHGINATKDKGSMHPENDESCSQGEKTYTRRHIIHCTPNASNHPTLPSNGHETRHRFRRILFLPPKKQARQLYLDNNSVVTYPFIQPKSGFCLAVAYIPSHRKLVVSAWRPKFFFFMPIDKENKTIIKTNLRVKVITIDDKKQLVFMVTKHFQNSLSVMSTHGKQITELSSSDQLRCVTELAKYNGLVSDHKRSLIYVLCLHQILQFTYHGVPEGNLVKSKVLLGFSLHIQGDSLYYKQCVNKLTCTIHTLSLSDHSEKQLTTLPIPGSQKMMTVDNILYMIPSPFKGDLLVVNMSGMGTVTKVNPGIKETISSTSYGVEVCLIPSIQFVFQDKMMIFSFTLLQ